MSGGEWPHLFLHCLSKIKMLGWGVINNGYKCSFGLPKRTNRRELTLQVAILKAQSKALEEKLAKNKGGDKK